jgi:hypothetical protein
MDTPSTEYEDFHHQFLEMESALGLFSLDVDGVPVWERIRHQISLTLLAEQDFINHPSGNATDGLAKQVRTVLDGLKNSALHNPFFADETDVLYVGEARRKLHDGCWWDIYCDPLHEVLSQDYLHVEPTWNGQHFRPARTEWLRYLDMVTLPAEVAKRTGEWTVALPDSVQGTLADLEAYIEDRFDVSVDVVPRVHTELAERSVEKRLLDPLVRRLDPDMAVLVSSTGKETLIESCHDHSVPVVELQHGSLNQYSYNYSFSGARTKVAFPDYVLTFGERWSDRVSFPIPSDRIRTVGYPYLEQALDRYADVERRKRVVFISTGETGQKLSKLAVTLSEDSTVSHDVVYKLHPDEYSNWTERHPWLARSGVDVVGRGGRSLYELLATSTTQVGVSSTALYEGLAFELDTYLVPMPTVEWLSPLVARGEAMVVESAESLVACLKDPPEFDAQPDQYFRPNALENAAQALEQIQRDGSVAPAHR